MSDKAKYSKMPNSVEEAADLINDNAKLEEK